MSPLECAEGERKSETKPFTAQVSKLWPKGPGRHPSRLFLEGRFYAQQTCSFIPAFSTAACMGQLQNVAVTGSPCPTKHETLPYLDLYRKKNCQSLVP